MAGQNRGLIVFEEVIGKVLVFAIHSILICAVLFGLYFIARLVYWRTDNPAEKLLRVLAIMLALLLYFMSRIGDVTIPDMLFQSLGEVSIGAQLLLMLPIGGFLGWVVAKYLHWLFLKGHEGRRIRYVILFFTLLLAFFTDVYIASYSLASGAGDARSLLPNGTFILGTGFYLLAIRQKDDAGWWD